MREEKYSVKFDAKIESLLMNGRMDECNEVKVKVKVKRGVMVHSRSYEGHLLGAPSCLVVGVVQGSHPGLPLPAEPHRLYLNKKAQRFMAQPFK